MANQAKPASFKKKFSPATLPRHQQGEAAHALKPSLQRSTASYITVFAAAVALGGCQAASSPSAEITAERVVQSKTPTPQVNVPQTTPSVAVSAPTLATAIPPTAETDVDGEMKAVKPHPIAPPTPSSLSLPGEKKKVVPVAPSGCPLPVKGEAPAVHPVVPTTAKKIVAPAPKAPRLAGDPANVHSYP